MPSLISFGRGSTTGVDLSANAFWRIMLGAASGTEMALMVQYPPTQVAPIGANMLVLAKVEVAVAKTAEELSNVAKTALSQGTLDLDIARATEGMNLFKMHQHVSEKAFEEALGNVLNLVRAYWAVRTWLEIGDGTQFTHEVGGWKLIGRP